MSLFEAPRIAVFVAPGAVACTPLGRAARPGNGYRAAVEGPAEMQAALADYLATRARPGVRLRVLLSHALANFVVAPWSSALLESRSADAYLRDAFESVLGEPARKLRVVAEDRGYRQPRLACGVDAAWLEAIEQAAKARQARIEWIGPWFERAWQRHRSRIEAADAWCIAVEREGYTIASVREGRVAELAFQPGDTSVAAIARQVQRLALRQGLETELPVWVVDGEAAGAEWPAQWKSVPWRDAAADRDARMAELAA